MRKHRKGRRKPAARRRTYQPELLEPRQLLAADPIVVDVAHVDIDPDDGVTSLREALVQAKANPGPDTITFHSSLPFESIRDPSGGQVIGTIVVVSGQSAFNDELVIDSDVTIDASNLGLLRIGHSSSALEHRVFRITEGADVVMKNLVIQGGTAGFAKHGPYLGAGIYNDGTLTLIDTIVGANTQFSEPRGGKLGGGGGIYNSGTGHLTLENTHVGALTIDNTVYEDLGLDLPDEQSTSQIFVRGNIAQGIGGGIFNEGVLRVTEDSSLVFNRSNYSGAGIYNAGTATISDSVLDGNQALSGFATGSGIKNSVRIDASSSWQTGYVDVWDIPVGPVSLTIQRSKILNHEAFRGAGIMSDAPLVIEETEFANNGVADRGLGNIAYGGAIAIEHSRFVGRGFPVDTTIARSLFRNNSAVGNGGAIGAFVDGQRPSTGAYSLTIDGSTFVDNSVTSRDRIPCGRFDASGCGAAVSVNTVRARWPITIRSSTFASNQVGRGARSGATYYADGGTTRIYNSIFSSSSRQSRYDLQVGGSFESLGYNIVRRSSLGDFALADTDLVTSSPGLGPLGDYGGPTQTIGLLPSSPALNSGPVSMVDGEIDQRGQRRKVGPAVDRGAFESRPLGRMVIDNLSGIADGFYTPGEVSLSDAVAWANAIPGPDTIRFSQTLLDQIKSDFDGSATITLGWQLNITDDLTILGPGAKALSLSGDKQRRIFQVEAGVSLDLRDLTLTEGRAPTNGESANNGGAIANFGNLRLQRVEMTDSHAPRLGGAISNESGSTLSIQSSTLAGNSAAKGGGFYSGGDVQVENSTIAENFAEEFGGGFVSFAGSVTLDHSTIVANNALHNSGGFRNEGAQVSMSNSVISKNTSSVDADYSQDPNFPDGQVTMGPFNFVGSSIDPLLGPLRDLGGPTRAVGILPSSPLIDAADPDSSLATDQRGFTRPVDSRPDDESGPADIGAFEYVAPDFTEGAAIVVDNLDSEEGGIADGHFAAGEFTLSEAVLFAAELPGANTIQFDESSFIDDDEQPVSRHITLEQSLQVFDELEIIGRGANLLTIHVGSAAKNGFEIAGSGTATLRDLTIDGNQLGRGINNSGDLALDRVYVTNGYAERGGGLFNTGDVALVRSTIANSTADSFGGGVYNQGNVSATNSTLSSNDATDGGGLWNHVGATADFLQSTISNNQSDNHGGIRNVGTIQLQSTIVAANDENFTRSRSDIGNVGKFTSNGFNLIGNVTSGSVNWSANDLVGEEPQLTGLVPIRGSVPMHGLLPSSPAIDAAGTVGQRFDQTGTARPLPVGGAYDIGAFEAKEFFWTDELVVTELTDVLDAEYEQGLTLREALLWANRKDGSNRERETDRITLDPNLAAEILADFQADGTQRTTIRLADDLLIEDAVEISPFENLVSDDLPPGLLQLTTDGKNRVLTVHGTADAVMIEDVTVMGGGGVQDGGGIYTAADLELKNVVLRDNQSTTRGGAIAVIAGHLMLDHSSVVDNSSLNAAGIYAAGDTRVDIAYSSIERNRTTVTAGRNIGIGGGVRSEGHLEIMSSTFAHNVAQTGGAFTSLGTLQMDNATISGNRARYGGGMLTQNSSVITNSTITGNRTIVDDQQSFGGSQDGKAIRNRGTLELYNSILYGNLADRGQTIVLRNVFNESLNGVNALVIAPPGNIYQESFDVVDQDPLLLPLADNGGPTKTHSLAPDSPAIDAGDPDYTPIVDQRGRPIVDIPSIDGNVVDIGAYEVQSIVNSDWNYSARGLSQFGEGEASVYGFGFDDGRAGSRVNRDPIFIGVPFDTGPMTLGGIADVLGAKFGGEIRADFAGRVGFDLGVYANSGSVDVDYGGMLNYVVDEDPTTGEIDVATFLAVDEGSLYTVSPKLGAYMDLVLELDASIGASGCLFGCVGFDVPFKVDEKIEMFAINRQARDSAGRPAFLDAEGNVVTREGNETLGDGVVPFFDGDIRIAGLNLWAPPIDVGKNDLQAKAEQQLAGKRLAEANSRLAKGNNEINRIDAMAKKQGLNPDSLTGDLKLRREAAIQNVIKANRDKTKLEADVRKSNPARNGKRTLGGGSGLQVSFAEASGSLLGVKGTVSAVAESPRFDRSPAIIEAGISKQIGSLALTMPDVNLRDVTPAGSAGRLSASTSDFPKSSELDAKRQLANLQVDAAGLLGPLLGIPAGRYAASLGPLSLTAQLISYDLGPQLNITQDVSAVPYAKKLTFQLDTDQAIVRVNDSEVTLSQDRSFTFDLGDRVSIQPKETRDDPIQVTPKLTMDVQYQNDLGLDIDLQGALEALSVGLNVGNNEIVKVGPLISEKHTLGTLDLGSLYKQSWNLFEQTIGLKPFEIGGGSQDGTTAGSALMGDVSPDGLTALVTTDVDSPNLPVFVSKDVVTDTGERFWPQVEYSVSGDQKINSLYVLHDDLTVDVLDDQERILDTLEPMMGRELVLEAPATKLRISGFSTDILGESSRIAVALKFASEGPTNITMELVGPSESLTPEDVITGNIAELDQKMIDNLGATAVIGFDVDGDGRQSPLTDGVLLMRYLDGLAGDALTANAVGKDATRDADQIRAYIDDVLDRTELLDGGESILTLDIDDDGLLKSNTDGQLIARFLAGFTGAELISGVVSADGKRSDPEEIAEFLRLGRVTTNNEVVIRPDENNVLVMSQGVGFDEVIQFGGGFDVFGVEDALDASDAPAGAAVGNPTSQGVEGAAAELAAMPHFATKAEATELRKFGFILANFGETIAYDELWIDGQRISRAAQGAPLNYASEEFEGLGDDALSRLERRTTSSVLGRDEPIYVQAPDAAGYTYRAYGGYLFEELSIDLQVGDNGYLGDGFDLYRGVKITDPDGEASIRWEFEVFMQKGNPQFDSGEGILTYELSQPLETFRLFPTALPNVEIHQGDNQSAPELLTTTGFTMVPGNDEARQPAIEMTQIALRKAPNDPPIVSLPVHVDGARAETLEHRFSIRRDNATAIAAGHRAYTEWGAVSETIQLASANQISIFGSDNANDTLRIDSIGGPIHAPIHFDGGARADTVVIAGEGIELDLAARDRFTGVEVIDIRGTGANTLSVDFESLSNNGGPANTIKILADDGDILRIGDGWQQLDVRDGLAVFQQKGMTLLVSAEALPIPETIEPRTPTQNVIPSRPTIIPNRPAEPSPIVHVTTTEANEAPLDPPADPIPVESAGIARSLNAVAATLSASTLAASEAVSLDVALDPSDGRTTGLHFRVHFDSTQIDIRRDENHAPLITGVFGESLSAIQVQSDGPCVESEEETLCRGIDQDELTDKYLNLLWLDVTGQWPANADELVELLSLAFIANDGFAEMTTVRFTGDVGGGVLLEPLARQLFSDERVDLNEDGALDAADIDFLFAAIRAAEDTQRLDLNDDQTINHLDTDVLLRDVFRTYRGDVNLDGQFNSNDLVSIFQIGEYEDGSDDNSTWADGDWDGNGEFDSGDLVVAFRDGGYARGARDSVPAVESLFSKWR